MPQVSSSAFRSKPQSSLNESNNLKIGHSRCSICGRKQAVLNEDDTIKKDDAVDVEKRKPVITDSIENSQMSKSDRNLVEDTMQPTNSHEQTGNSCKIQLPSISNIPNSEANNGINSKGEELCEGGLRKANFVVYRDARGRFARGPQSR
ncbi:hypothetical protein DICVIV_02814 [Dictyocaulus viviparus]|uniref:Uncharacterized protein n=1 Tax=Dictyocaulus viviparus TaxID=29172 RepID=A0A0D8Y2E5_DICVI|nr:hypothetical protein DICVIV_02814 [Dictyocaulus viviparus]